MTSSYNIIDFSIAGTQEAHPDWVVRLGAVTYLRQCCEAVDMILDDSRYELKTDIRNGDVLMCIIDPDWDAEVCTVCVPNYFLTGKSAGVP